MRRLLLIGCLLVGACVGQSKMIRTLEDGPADENSFKVGVLHLFGEIDERTTRAKADAVFDRNWARAEPLVRRAAAFGAKVIVTPEYGISGGGIGADECFSCSSLLPETPTPEPLHRSGNTEGPWVEYLNKSSRLADELDIYLLVQALEREADGETWKYYNTLCAFDPNGALLATYRKINLYLTEIIGKTAGSETVCFDTPYGRFAMLLCSDAAAPWTVRRCIVHDNVDFFAVASRWQPYLPISGNTTMNVLAATTGKPVLWANHNATWGTAGGAGVIRAGAANDTNLGMFDGPGVVVANLPLPHRIARVPR